MSQSNRAPANGYHSPLSDQQEQSFTQEHEHEPRKRRRVAVACKGCRTRKTRCNGIRPKCSTCAELNLECVYQQPAQPLRVRQGTELPSESQAGIVNRLEALEQTLRRLTNDSLDVDWARPVGVANEAACDESVGGGSRYEDNAVEEDEEYGGNVDKTDGMAAVLVEEPGQNVGFFGASSNIVLLETITRSMARMVARGAPGEMSYVDQNQYPTIRNADLSPFSGAGRGSHMSSKSSSSDDLLTLPLENEVMQMIELYFKTVGFINPVLDKDAVVKNYHRVLANGVRSVTRSWLALLNAIFAICSNVTASTSPTQELAEVAEKYCRRAVALVMPDIIMKSTFQNAQLLAVLVSYLQGTQHSSKAWTFHGLAVKTALELGLHDEDSARNASVKEKEMRKRAWCWIVIHDRILSTNFGRPPMIPKSLSNVRLPEVLDEGEQSGIVTPPLVNTGVLMFKAVITLTSVLSEGVATLYGENATKNNTVETQTVLSNLFNVTCKLLDWKLGLPESIQITTAEEFPTLKDQCVELQRCRVLLTIRYLGVRIAVLRPILGSFLDHTVDSTHDQQRGPLLRNHGIHYLRDCVASCKELMAMIDAILETYRSGIEIMGAWWFSAYFTFNASLVLLGVLLVSENSSFEDLFTTESTNSIRALIDRASRLLQELDKGNPMIQRCIVHLLRLVREYSKISRKSPLGCNDSTALRDYIHQGLGTMLQAEESFQSQDSSALQNMTDPEGQDLASFDLPLDTDFLGGMNVDFWI